MIQYSLVCALQHHTGCNPVLVGFDETFGTYAPTVSMFQSGESATWSAQVVSTGKRKLQKIVRDEDCHVMHTGVIRIERAIAIAQISCQRNRTVDFQFGS